jgi:hypothetical protein
VTAASALPTLVTARQTGHLRLTRTPEEPPVIVPVRHHCTVGGAVAVTWTDPATGPIGPLSDFVDLTLFVRDRRAGHGGVRVRLEADGTCPPDDTGPVLLRAVAWSSSELPAPGAG